MNRRQHWRVICYSIFTILNIFLVVLLIRSYCAFDYVSIDHFNNWELNKYIQIRLYQGTIRVEADYVVKGSLGDSATSAIRHGWRMFRHDEADFPAIAFAPEPKWFKIDYGRIGDGYDYWYSIDCSLWMLCIISVAIFLAFRIMIYIFVRKSMRLKSM